MAAKTASATEALVIVVDALESLSETDRQWVLQAAASRWAIAIQSSAGQGGGSGGSGNSGNDLAGNLGKSEAQSTIAQNDVRAFIRHKKPATDVERVACLVYFLTKTTNQHGFSSQMISAAHTESGGSAINMHRALDNATRGAKFISNRGAREKQITPLGEDVVEALPNRDAVAAAQTEARQRKSRKGPKASKNKKKS